MFAVLIRTLDDVEHVLLGFMVFDSLLLLFIAWGLRASRRSVERMQHDVEAIKKLPT